MTTNKLYDIDVDVEIKLFSLLYADDTIIMAESELELQSALDAVHDYCTNLCLTVNTSNTKIMIFSRAKLENTRILCLEILL